MKSSKQTLSGVGWRDVEEWVEDFEKEYKAMVNYQIYRAARALGQPCGLTVVLEVQGWDSAGKRGWRRHYKASWPTYGNKTMPGLLLYLLHSAHEDITFRPPQMRTQRLSPAFPVE